MDKHIYQNKDFFQILGHISVFFATLDFLVTYFILELLNDGLLVLEKKKMEALNEQTLGQKLNFLKKIKENKIKDKQIYNDLQTILNDAIVLSEKRNRFIHDQWVFKDSLIEKGNIELVKLKYSTQTFNKYSRFSLKTTNENYSIGDLYGFLKEIGNMQKHFAKITKSILPDNK